MMMTRHRASHFGLSITTKLSHKRSPTGDAIQKGNLLSRRTAVADMFSYFCIMLAFLMGVFVPGYSKN